jgi:hypothetical protein
LSPDDIIRLDWKPQENSENRSGKHYTFRHCETHLPLIRIVERYFPYVQFNALDCPTIRYALSASPTPFMRISMYKIKYKESKKIGLIYISSRHCSITGPMLLKYSHLVRWSAGTTSIATLVGSFGKWILFISSPLNLSHVGAKNAAVLSLCVFGFFDRMNDVQYPWIVGISALSGGPE